MRALAASTASAGGAMQGDRHSVTGAGGVRIGLLTAGSGDDLLLVHGGASQIEAWEPVWEGLARRWRVTAMDRRGRGTSGDAEPYAIGSEFADVAAVAGYLAEQAGGPVDVFGHSYGAVCALGAAAGPGPVRRLVLYEPPGPAAAPAEWAARMTAMFARGQAGRAMVSFLTEIIGLTPAQVLQLRNTPRSYDVLRVAAATLPREAVALAGLDLPGLAGPVTCPVLLLLGTQSPPWARDITGALAAALPGAELVTLPGQGHDAIDSAPELLVAELGRFLGNAA
jgi:pimeloyl-ACP methyl ester carboxylesterase